MRSAYPAAYWAACADSARTAAAGPRAAAHCLAELEAGPSFAPCWRTAGLGDETKHHGGKLQCDHGACGGSTGSLGSSGASGSADGDPLISSDPTLPRSLGVCTSDLPRGLETTRRDGPFIPHNRAEYIREVLSMYLAQEQALMTARGHYMHAASLCLRCRRETSSRMMMSRGRIPDSCLPADGQGLNVLSCLVGHEDFVARQLRQKR